MATGPDLVGLGMPGQLAEPLGFTNSSVTCAGTTQATATPVLTKNTELTAASSQTGAILPSGAKIGSIYETACVSATSAVLYVPVGHSLNGTINVGLTIAQNKAAILWRSKGNDWRSVLTA